MTGLGSWFALALCVVGNVTANIGFKRLVETVEPSPTIATFIAVVSSPWAWLGGCGSLLLLGSYLYAIRHLPLGVAYPIATSMGTVAVALAGMLVFSEPARLTGILGIGFVVIGVLLIAR